MIDLYRRHGSAPAPLPSITYDDENNAYTPPYADDDLDRLGFVLAPARPDDTDTQTAQWDATAEAWAMVDRPAPPPAPEPQPVTLTVGDLVARFRIPAEVAAFDQLEDAMALESRLVRRQWANDATVMTEGDGLWQIVAGHLDEIVTPERKAELLSRPGAFAASADATIAA